MTDSPRLAPLDRNDPDKDPRLEPIYESLEELTGFVTNALLIMARGPEVLKARVDLGMALYKSTSLDLALFDLIGQVASSMGDCTYSQQHRADASKRRGVSPEKFQAIAEFETSPLFSDAERAALRLARHAFTVPNAVTDEDFVELRKHYSEDEIVVLVGRLAQSAFMTTWNNTMGQSLEK